MQHRSHLLLAGGASLLLAASVPSSAHACASGFLARSLCSVGVLSSTNAQGLDRASARAGNPLEKAARVGVVAAGGAIGGPAGAGAAAAGVAAVDGKSTEKIVGDALAYTLGYGVIKGLVVGGSENMRAP